MPFVNCFDIVQMVTDEASAQFAPLFCENKEAKAILHQYCDAIDVLAREFDEELYERSARGRCRAISASGSSVRFSYRAVDKTLTFFFLRDTLELPAGQYWPRGNICLGGSLCRKLKKKR